MSSTTVTAPPQENGHHDNHIKRSLQSKFAMANEESAAAAQGEAWQTRDARLPVVLLPPPTDVAILRRYAVEAEKQNLGEHFSQVNQAFRILFFAIVALALSALIVAIGLPAKWALALLDKASTRKEALSAYLKERVTGERVTAFLAFIERLVNNTLDLAERVTGRKGLAERARQKAADTKSQLVQLETEVQRKKEQLLSSLATGKQELRQREASVAGVLREQRDEFVQRIKHGAREVYTVISPLKSGLRISRRISEFIAIANILVQTVVALSLILLSLPRNVLNAALGRTPAPLHQSVSSVESSIKKTE